MEAKDVLMHALHRLNRFNECTTLLQHCLVAIVMIKDLGSTRSRLFQNPNLTAALEALRKPTK